jgi:hypothetical protein
VREQLGLDHQRGKRWRRKATIKKIQPRENVKEGLNAMIMSARRRGVQEERTEPLHSRLFRKHKGRCSRCSRKGEGDINNQMFLHRKEFQPSPFSLM